jgi:3-deoxy-manno-octulosonate cytidylyltransferase (CMP-KDO synthetase)
MRCAGVDRVVVATDDDRIARPCRRVRGRGGHDLGRLPQRHRTLRRGGAAGRGLDIVVNLQGDAPLTPPGSCRTWSRACAPPGPPTSPPRSCAATADAGGLPGRPPRGPGRRHHGRVRRGGRALYFSKEVIPYTGRTTPRDEPTPVFHHVGVYAYRPAALAAYPGWPIGPLERLEGLEQLRFLENGRPVLCVEVEAGAGSSGN